MKRPSHRPFHPSDSNASRSFVNPRLNPGSHFITLYGTSRLHVTVFLVPSTALAGTPWLLWPPRSLHLPMPGPSSQRHVHPALLDAS